MIAAFRKTSRWLALPALAMAVLLAAATLTSAATAVAQKVENAAAPATAPAASNVLAADADLQRKLATHIAEFKTDPEHPPQLNTILDFLRQTAGINIVMDAQSLADAGIDAELTLQSSLKLTDVTARQVLEAALLSSGGRVTFITSDGIMIITTPAAARANAASITRVYDVSDLLAIPTAPAQVFAQGANGQSVAQSVNESGTAEDLSRLLDAITSSVQPDAWRERNGKIASASGYKNSIIITAPADMQEQVTQLLKKLRAPETK